jgi:hypothetical protein
VKEIRHIIPAGDLSRTHRTAVCDEISELDDKKAWLVQVTPYRKKRSTEQNAFLHGVSLKLICEHTGYEIDDMKMYLMGKAFGWEEYEIMGERRRRPLKGTSDLNTEQFSWFMEWVESWASQELGLLIPKPNEVIA